MLYEQAQQPVIQLVSGFNTAELADQTVAQQIEITNCIKNLVLDELIFVTQAIFIEHVQLVDHNCIVHTAAQGHVLGTEVLDVAHEAEGTGTTDFLDKRRAGKIDTGRLRFVGKRRMIKVNGKAHLEPVKGHEGSAFITIRNGHFTQYTDEFFRYLLLFQSGRLNEKDKRTGTAIHDRHFRCRQLYISVINPQTGHRGQQMLHGVHLDVTLDQGGRHGGFAHISSQRRYLHDRIEVSTAEDNSGIGRGGLEGQINLFPRMQANAGSPDSVLQCALFDHGLVASRRVEKSYQQ